MTENKDMKFSEEQLNKDIEVANALIEESNEGGFSKWEDLITSLINVSKHYIQYIQSAKEDDEQAQIFQYKLDELSTFVIFAEKENFKIKHTNLHDLDLYFLMQFHLNEGELDKALALGFITIREDYFDKTKYEDAKEYDADLETIREEFAEIFDAVAPKVEKDLQEEIQKDPIAYYLAKID